VSPLLPPALRQAMTRLIERESSKTIAVKSQALSERYRGGSDSSDAVRDDADAAAYLAARMPATYAAMASVLSRVGFHAPGFAPVSLLDAGAGPGTASFAAAEQWPSLQQVTMVERNLRMIAAANALRENASSPALRDAAIRESDITNIDTTRSHDLVLMGYAVAEIPEAALTRVLDASWRTCAGILVIVEPGTPEGFARILQCRVHLLRLGARIVAPCPGDYQCPNDWCHFAVRLPRSKSHMRAKNASVPFEDEKFSYLAVARENIAISPATARIVAEPHVSKPGVSLRLCAGDEISERFVARRDKPAYKQAAKSKWGDAYGL
jgi:ribosomal protein RSM22 (predicted rRNA methylase)